MAAPTRALVPVQSKPVRASLPGLPCTAAAAAPLLLSRPRVPAAEPSGMATHSCRAATSPLVRHGHGFGPGVSCWPQASPRARVATAAARPGDAAPGNGITRRQDLAPARAGGGGGDHSFGGPSLELSSALAALVGLNIAIFAAAVYAQWPAAASLALYNSKGAWWQFVTSAFAHANLTQLSRNMFLLWLWGSALQPVVTGPGVWFTYLVSAVGANVAAAHFMGLKAKAGALMLGLGASGGIAGVALAALLLTARPSLRWLMGTALAIQFTLPALLTAPVPGLPAAGGNAAAAGQTALSALLPSWLIGNGGGAAAGAAASSSSGSSISGFLASLKSPAMAWLWGAAAGALLVVALAKLPVPPE